MQPIIEPNAFSSGKCVREIALRIMHMSEAIHHALRKLTSIPSNDNSGTSPYALLTEEYALRARASILLIEADRLARPSFPVRQTTVLDILGQVETTLSQANSADDMNELIASLLLFTSSIISRRNHIIAVLLENLQQTVAELQANR
jgi:hypothetical protein